MPDHDERDERNDDRRPRLTSVRIGEKEVFRPGMTRDEVIAAVAEAIRGDDYKRPPDDDQR